MIYVHIPFCRSFCTYCDFYSEVAGKCSRTEDIISQERLFERFVDALCEEVRFRAEEISDTVNTLYIGGGTPSVLPLSAFNRLLDTLKTCGHGGPYAEFTVEVNPEDIVEKGRAYVEGLLSLGVNRISMGIQSFDDGILKFMNRRHDSQTAREAYSILEEAGVENISIDLIFGLPQLSDDQWKTTLDCALNISSKGQPPKHISSYQLSVEPGSMLAKLVERGQWSEASEDICSRQYQILCETLKKAGYNHYEISNFALPGYEAVHNYAYWRHVPYVGLGPGAHSFVVPQSSLISAERRWNEQNLSAYINNPTDVCDGEILAEEQLILEKIMLALRTAEGISESFLRKYADLQELEMAINAGNLVRVQDFHASDSRLRIPESKFFISDSIVASIV